MKARYFTYGKIPKAVYYLTDIKGELYPQHSAEDFYEELEKNGYQIPMSLLLMTEKLHIQAVKLNFHK
jgi:hypothetical protein